MASPRALRMLLASLAVVALSVPFLHTLTASATEPTPTEAAATADPTPTTVQTPSDDPTPAEALTPSPEASLPESAAPTDSTPSTSPAPTSTLAPTSKAKKGSPGINPLGVTPNVDIQFVRGVALAPFSDVYKEAGPAGGVTWKYAIRLMNENGETLQSPFSFKFRLSDLANDPQFANAKLIGFDQLLGNTYLRYPKDCAGSCNMPYNTKYDVNDGWTITVTNSQLDALSLYVFYPDNLPICDEQIVNTEGWKSATGDLNYTSGFEPGWNGTSATGNNRLTCGPDPGTVNFGSDAYIWGANLDWSLEKSVSEAPKVTGAPGTTVDLHYTLTAKTVSNGSGEMTVQQDVSNADSTAAHSVELRAKVLGGPNCEVRYVEYYYQTPTSETLTSVEYDLPALVAGDEDNSKGLLGWNCPRQPASDGFIYIQFEWLVDGVYTSTIKQVRDVAGGVSDATLSDTFPEFGQSVGSDPFDITPTKGGVYKYTATRTIPAQGCEDFTNTATLAPGGLEPIEKSQTVTLCANAGEAVWTKADRTGTILAGSEWTLTAVDAAGDPLAGSDAYSEDIADNSTADRDPADGKFKVANINAGVRYRLVEKTAPAGYYLDTTPRYVEADAAGFADFGTVTDYLQVDPTPFPCPVDPILLTQSGPAGTSMSLAKYTTPNLTFNQIGAEQAPTYNAVAFNSLDRFSYAIDSNPLGYRLLKLGYNGGVQDLGSIGGLPTGLGSFDNGAIDNSATARTMYIATSGTTKLYTINVAAKSATVTTLSQAWGARDFTLVGGRLFGVEGTILWRLDPATGHVDTFDLGAALGGAENGSGGAVFTFPGDTSSGGEIGVVSDTNGTLSRLMIVDPQAAAPSVSLQSQTSTGVNATIDGTYILPCGKANFTDTGYYGVFNIRYNWTLLKSSQASDFQVAAGATVSVPYEIRVGVTRTIDNVYPEGVVYVTIKNPNAVPMNGRVTVSSTIGSAYCTDKNVTIKANGSLGFFGECIYQGTTNQSSISDTLTVTFTDSDTGEVTTFTTSVYIASSVRDSSGTVSLSDTYPEFGGPLTILARDIYYGGGSKVYKYSVPFTADAAAGDCHLYTNDAVLSSGNPLTPFKTSSVEVNICTQVTLNNLVLTKQVTLDGAALDPADGNSLNSAEFAVRYRFVPPAPDAPGAWVDATVKNGESITISNVPQGNLVEIQEAEPDPNAEGHWVSPELTSGGQTVVRDITGSWLVSVDGDVTATLTNNARTSVLPSLPLTGGNPVALWALALVSLAGLTVGFVKARRANAQ